MTDTDIEDSLPAPPQLSPEEDLRRTRLFLTTLGLTGKYLDLYSSTLTLKEVINLAKFAAGMNTYQSYDNLFTSFCRSRLNKGASPNERTKMIRHLNAHPSELIDAELVKLSSNLKTECKQKNPIYLDCDSAQLKALEKRALDVYDADPTLAFLKAAGINAPENMDNCGFIDAVYKLCDHGKNLTVAQAAFLPLPLSEGKMHAFLTHPTIDFATQLGRLLAATPKARAYVQKFNNRMSAKAYVESAFDYIKGSARADNEERFARRWAIQYIFEHLYNATTGKPASLLETSDFIQDTFEYSQGFNTNYFQPIGNDPERTLKLMQFLTEKVRNGELRYDGEASLESLTTIEGIQSVGRMMLEQSRARRAEVAAKIKAQGLRRT